MSHKNGVYAGYLADVVASSDPGVKLFQEGLPDPIVMDLTQFDPTVLVGVHNDQSILVFTNELEQLQAKIDAP